MTSSRGAAAHRNAATMAHAGLASDAQSSPVRRGARLAATGGAADGTGVPQVVSEPGRR